MSLNVKKFLNIFFENFICKKYFEKFSGFLAPFSAAAITAAGDNFLTFFFTF